MKFSLSSTALSSRLSILARVIGSKNSIQILDCFLFEIKGNELKMTASDNENVMVSTLQLDQCDGEGCFAVPNQTILDAVKELPEQPLEFDVDLNTNTIKIVYQNGIYNFTTQNGDEYPEAQPISEDASTITIDESVLSANISRSIFATAQDDLRPVMNGLYFDLNANGLAIVASDGHKLVRNRILNITSDVPTSFILPKKPAGLLKNVLGKGGEDVVIRFDGKNAEITFAEGSLICRLIEGRYPNYNSVIPTDNPNNITIDRKSLLSALRRVIPFSSDSSQLIRLHLDAGHLEISAEDIDFATSAKESLPCDYTGSKMDIGFKGSSLQEILNNFDSDNVVISLADPSRAGIIVPVEQPEQQDVLMLLMPMLLND